jgi:NAD(P)-dependent dehydrogenase (short-subunit alcohol dehydrogenase family)
MANKTPTRLMDSGFTNTDGGSTSEPYGRQVYVITGGNSGIGFEAAKHLGKAGDIVLAIPICRKPNPLRLSFAHVRGKVDVLKLDLVICHRSVPPLNIREKYSKIDA